MTLRIAIVGAGPSGLYATDALNSAGHHVDVIERLPVPFGLVRYGVAPDHYSIRSVRGTLEKVLLEPNVRLLAGVEVGRDVSVDELLAAYDGVILTYGASRDRLLQIPGEDLPGSLAATDLVAWYCGHPDADRAAVESALSAATSVVVVGVGNVSVDVTRVLTAPADRLERTDMPQHVLDILESSGIRDVHVLGRRSPAQATWTTKELRELGEIDGIDVVVEPADFELEPVVVGLMESDRVVARNVEVMRGWIDNEPAEGNRHIHLHFHSRPAEITGTDRVSGVVVERTALDESGAARGTGETYEIEAQLIVRSVGYRGMPLAGVPFDASRHVVPNADGRVLGEDGVPIPGLYVAGWIKRGPTGIIGTNKKDAGATVASLLADRVDIAPRGGDGVFALLLERGITPIHIDGWQAVDAAERALGQAQGRDRTTIHEHDSLRAAASGVE